MKQTILSLFILTSCFYTAYHASSPASKHTAAEKEILVQLPLLGLTSSDDDEDIDLEKSPLQGLAIAHRAQQQNQANEQIKAASSTPAQASSSSLVAAAAQQASSASTPSFEDEHTKIPLAQAASAQVAKKKVSRKDIQAKRKVKLRDFIRETRDAIKAEHPEITTDKQADAYMMSNVRYE